MEYILQSLLQFFLEHDPGAPANIVLIQVSYASSSHMHKAGICIGRDGTTPVPVTLDDGSTVRVWPVLAFVEGDIPWLEKLTNSIGHGAKHACYRCAFNGVWHLDANTVRYELAAGPCSCVT